MQCPTNILSLCIKSEQQSRLRTTYCTVCQHGMHGPYSRLGFIMHNVWKESSETSIRPSVFFIIRAYLGHWPMGSNIYDFGIKKSPSYPNFFEIPPGYCIPRRVTHNPGESTFSSKLMHTVSQKWMWILILLIEGYISSFFLA